MFRPRPAWSQRMFTVGSSGGLIGRSRKCAISLLHDCEVSHNHAVIELQCGAYCIRDVGSTLGTYLNDKRLSEPKRASESHKLKPCDSIKVGQTSLRWWPISSITCAASVTIPYVLSQPADYLSRVPAAVLPAEDHEALSRALTMQRGQVGDPPPRPRPPQPTRGGSLRPAAPGARLPCATAASPPTPLALATDGRLSGSSPPRVGSPSRCGTPSAAPSPLSTCHN